MPEVIARHETTNEEANMAAIVSGNSLSQVWGAVARPGNDNAHSYVNIVNCNGIPQGRDHFMAARGGHEALRTYNSQGPLKSKTDQSLGTGRVISLSGPITAP
jgi:hypothetical protein